MHNNIIAAGLRDRPPMLATGPGVTVLLQGVHRPFSEGDIDDDYEDCLQLLLCVEVTCEFVVDLDVQLKIEFVVDSADDSCN
nr:hypothetical protein [Tanacetum cinerariifolium]